MKYIVRYGSNSQRPSMIENDSRDAKKLGQKLLGHAGGGYVKVYNKSGTQLSYARFTPEGNRWYSAVY